MDRAVKKLCIVSPYSYPLFNPEQCRSHFGGWEVRTFLIAKELAKRGKFEVSMVVWDHGQPHVECREGVTLYSWTGNADPSVDSPDKPTPPPPVEPHEQSANNPCPRPPVLDTKTPSQASRVRLWLRKNVPFKLRFMVAVTYAGLKDVLAALYRGGRSILGILYWSGRSILAILYSSGSAACAAIYHCVKALLDVLLNWFGVIGNYPVLRDRIAIYEEIDADLYLVPGNHNRAAEVACFCKRRGKKYVFLAGSDMDYDSIYRDDPDKCDVYGVPGYLMVYTINAADLHVVQSSHQSLLLRTTYGRSSVVIRNPIDPIPLFARNPSATTILWVGSADDRVRRPSMVLELARRMPDCSFVVIMVPAVDETERRCRETAAALPNVTVVGRTPYRDVEKYYADARLLVNTSVFEGFPNSFLQAAKYGVPIVAAKVDPGQILTRYGCGLTSNDDIGQLERNVRLLLNDHDLYARFSADCIEYVREHHDKALIVPRLEDALLACSNATASFKFAEIPQTSLQGCSRELL